MENQPNQFLKLVIPDQGDKAQNFGLGKEEYNHMVLKMIEGDDTIFEHIFLTHFEECRKYISAKFAIDYDESYDVTMDTLLEFRTKLIQGKLSYGNLKYLFTRMASNNFVDAISLKNKMKHLLIADDINETDHEGHFDLLHKSWATLGESDKTLLTQVYYEDTSLKDIAASSQMNDATLRKKKQRAIETLRKAFFGLYNH
jgi:RNA polymerase sigma factor (sigma-70 family)